MECVTKNSLEAAFFLVRLDLRLEEAEGMLSEGGMDGPAADLCYRQLHDPREFAMDYPYSEPDIAVASFPFLFLVEWLDGFG